MVIVLVPWVALLVFVAAVVARIARIVSLPVHLRWELYPVAHERNASYGGSFFEHLNWWQQPRAKNHFGTLRAMVPEIVLLQGVYAHNRALWRRSFPFHLGLYCGAGFLVLLIAGAVLQIVGTPVGAQVGGAGTVLHWLTAIVGIAGLVLAFSGGLGLLLRRLRSPVLRAYSSAADLLNLVLFLTVTGLGLLTVILVDPDFSGMRTIAASALLFRPHGSVPVLSAATVVMTSALFAYVPTTHMSHFFTKWFMYHDIRWDDAVNEVGSPLERRILRQLSYRVTWSADHVRGGGRSWAAVATEEIVGKEGKEKP